MMCLFADLSLYRGTRRQPLHRTCNSKRISLRGFSPRRISARLLDVCDLTAIATATPWPQSCRGVANLSLRASAIFKIRCAQPVKRSNPYLAISIAVFSALRHRFCAAASQSVLAPGFRGDATLTGRFRCREASRFRATFQVLFFACNGGLRFSPYRNTTWLWRDGCAQRARNSSQIVARSGHRQSRVGKQRADRRFLADSQLHDQITARRQ